MTVNAKAYGVVAFYGILCILTAFLGSLVKGNEGGKNGFTGGYVIGILLSLILWFTVGKKMMD